MSNARVTEVSIDNLDKPQYNAVYRVSVSPSVTNVRVFALTTALGKPFTITGKMKPSLKHEEVDLEDVPILAVVVDRTGMNGDWRTMHILTQTEDAHVIPLQNGVNGTFAGSYRLRNPNVQYEADDTRVRVLDNGAVYYQPFVPGNPETMNTLRAVGALIAEHLNETPNPELEKNDSPFE